ncbi:unnamed protein product (macronuclear) [Paramecium tetraurelia]|uniref:PAS domain-containing protein n=1 Tax=Paramecium tetraurelia TaxID=5888 RepID=A0CQ34_PARTE|nr:uncharacterized protein GSPATT00009249001 [Paramecium tetraurelia]CAK72901.1 unnamed protein product [Paramecium tetraurelia]|eukprot:XP_001440298.1 hypothetical protein (macronuclear) [Paramecium tetraurelia strain d4-2]
MRNFLFQVKDFYIQQFLTVKGIWRKSLELSIGFLIVENIQLLSLITQTIPVLNKAEYLDFIHYILNIFRFYSVLGEYIEMHILFMLIGFILTFLTFICLVILILNTSVRINQNGQIIEMTLEINRQKEIEQNTMIKQFISVYMQIYYMLMRIPLLYSHFHILNYYQKTNSLNQFLLFGASISMFSIALQLIFSLIIDLHCFEFKMKNQDFLGRFNQQKVHLVFAFQTMIVILIGLEVNTITVQVFYLIYLLMNVIMSYHQLVYVEVQISQLQLHISSYLLIYQIALLVVELSDVVDKLNILGFLLFFYPFIAYILKTLTERQKLSQLKSSGNSLEKQIRFIYHLFKKQIKLKKEQRSLDPMESLFMYSFITNHLRYCSQNRERKLQKQIKMKFKCFCEEFSEKENFQFNSITQMKMFAKELISQTLEDEIIETSNTYLTLIYIYFLVQVKKLPTQAIYEVIRLSMQSQGMALKEQAIIYKLKYDALEEFDQLVKKNDLKNQKYIFKRVYQYEESLSIIKQNMCLIARQFKEWYGLILTSIIDIDQLATIGFEILSNMKAVESQLQQAFTINPLSNECDTIYNLFSKYIQYNKSRPKLYRLEGKLVTFFMQSIEKTIFDPGSCVIQITLLQPRGNVIRYTRSFQQAIGFKDEEIKDQNIHRFMPQIIADDHDMYLDNFVERGRIIVVRSEVRVILGKNKGQFLVPINTRLRIETSPTEFGATALITPVNLTFGYMILNEKGQIEEITQNIFEEMFQKHLGISVQQIRGLDCLFFVPELAKIWEEIYDQNFDKLDRKFECQFIIPLINQNKSMSQSQLSKSLSKLYFQKQIYKNFENQPTENVIFLVQLHVMSLVTINLRLVILELQDFRLMPNLKISSKQIIQLRGRTSKQFNIQQFQNSTSYRENASLLNSPWVLDCDLDHDLLEEEERMIYEVKNQLATVNITNTTHHQQIQLIQYAEDEIQNENESLQEQKQNVPKEGQPSIKIDEKKKNQMNKVDNQNNMSIGSRSSQNNQSQLKRQMRDCLSENSTLNKKQAFVLLAFYLSIIGSYILNCLLFSSNYQKIQQNQSSQNLPYQLSYFYNEFVISSYYLKYSLLFPFSDLQQISLDFYQSEIKNIDDALKNIPEIEEVNVDNSLNQQSINIIQQMMIQKSNQLINYNAFLNNTKYFENIVYTLYKADTTRNITNIQYIVIAEEIVLVLFICWYAYKCIILIQMKQKVYKLFCTFTTDVIQEQYVTFSSLHSLMNTVKFKKEETNEEKFELIMGQAFHKQTNNSILEKYQKVGKRIKQKKNNSTQIIFFLFVLIMMIVCSIYFIGSNLLHQATIDKVLIQFNDKILFQQAYYEITLAFAQSSVFIQTKITSDILAIQNNTVNELNTLRKKLSLYQQDQTIYNIVTKSACNIFNDSLTSIQQYDDLFSYEQCMSIPILQGGLSVIFADLCDQQLRFLQDLENNASQEYLQQNYYSAISQIERLYDSMGFFVIVSTLTNQIKQSVQDNINLDIILVVFSAVLMTISMIIMIISMRNIRSHYQTSKQLLTLVPLERLLENAYILSFIQQDIKLQN